MDLQFLHHQSFLPIHMARFRVCYCFFRLQASRSWPDSGALSLQPSCVRRLTRILDRAPPLYIPFFLLFSTLVHSRFTSSTPVFLSRSRPPVPYQGPSLADALVDSLPSFDPLPLDHLPSQARLLTARLVGLVPAARIRGLNDSPEQLALL